MMQSYVEAMFCEIGRLKSGLLWVADEMLVLLVVLSIGSMLAVGALAYFGSGMRATQWMSALAALWIASTGASAAAFFVGEGTLPCEVEFKSSTDAGDPIARTIKAPDTSAIAKIDYGTGGEDGAGERGETTPPPRDPRAPHPSEREVRTADWPATKSMLQAMGAGAQEAIWFGNQWMNEKVTKGTRKVTVRTAHDGTVVLRGYHRAAGEGGEQEGENAPQWVLRDLDTDEMVIQRAGEGAPEAEEM